MSNQMQDLSSDLEQSQMKFRELKKQLNAANLSLAATMEKENELRNKNENLVLEEAQVRYDMDQLRKQISDQLHERDQAHSDRAQLLEKVRLKSGHGGLGSTEIQKKCLGLTPILFD